MKALRTKRNDHQEVPVVVGIRSIVEKRVLSYRFRKNCGDRKGSCKVQGEAVVELEIQTQGQTRKGYESEIVMIQKRNGINLKTRAQLEVIRVDELEIAVYHAGRQKEQPYRVVVFLLSRIRVYSAALDIVYGSGDSGYKRNTYGTFGSEVVSVEISDYHGVHIVLHDTD